MSVRVGKLMAALLNGIHDRSSVVQKAFACAIGHLVRVSVNADPALYVCASLVFSVSVNNCLSGSV